MTQQAQPQQQGPDLWMEVCSRAGISRKEGDVGFPAHIPQTTLFAWHPTKDDPNNVNPNCSLPHATKPTVFQVGDPCPLKKIFDVVAVFDDPESPFVRIYAVPKEKQPKPEDNIPLRWKLTRTTTTMSVDQFVDIETLFDALGAELLMAQDEFGALPEDGCPSCEDPVGPDDVFCKKCGAKLPEDEDPPSGPVPAGAQQPGA